MSFAPRPAPLSHPDGVRALAAADVERPAGTKLRCLADQVGVGTGLAAPRLASRAIRLVPELLAEGPSQGAPRDHARVRSRPRMRSSAYP